MDLSQRVAERQNQWDGMGRTLAFGSLPPSGTCSLVFQGPWDCGMASSSMRSWPDKALLHGLACVPFSTLSFMKPERRLSFFSPSF